MTSDVCIRAQRIQYAPTQFPPIITRVTNNRRKGFVSPDKSGKFRSEIAIKNLTSALVENTSDAIASICL